MCKYAHEDLVVPISLKFMTAFRPIQVPLLVVVTWTLAYIDGILYLEIHNAPRPVNVFPHYCQMPHSGHGAVGFG